MLKLGPLRLHWSLLLGAVLFCAAQPRPAFLLGYAAVLLAHALGHLLALRGSKLSLQGLLVHGLGVELVTAGDATPLRRSALALAGPLCQLALACGSLWLPRGELADALGQRNLIVLLLNLIPIAPLDGAVGWKIFSRWKSRPRARPRMMMVADAHVSRQVKREVAQILDRVKKSKVT